MEAFSLLKYWRGSGGGGFSTGGGCADGDDGGATRPTTTTIVTAVTHHAAEEPGDDDGPFFDLEFDVHDEAEKEEEEEEEAKNEDEEEEESRNDDVGSPKQQQKQETVNEKEKGSKILTVKLEVDEVPIMSLFTRDNNSSRKSQKQSVEDSKERKFSKDAMQKYLKMVKPFYVRVTKSVQSTPLKSTAEKSQQLDQTAELKAPAGVVASRRDDSLLQQQDGIQSAILHCKRSFNASRDSDSSLLARSGSEIRLIEKNES